MDDPNIDAEEDENITHMAVVTQEPPPGVARVKIPAQSMNQRHPSDTRTQVPARPNAGDSAGGYTQLHPKKKLVRLKRPRLPSALGLSGACGVEA
eukprot:scaffold13687_cov125-Isochrysis_galbana.AAC.4